MIERYRLFITTTNGCFHPHWRERERGECSIPVTINHHQGVPGTRLGDVPIKIIKEKAKRSSSVVLIVKTNLSQHNVLARAENRYRISVSMNTQHVSPPSPPQQQQDHGDVAPKMGAQDDGSAEVQQQQHRPSHQPSPLDALVETEKLNRRKKGKHWSQNQAA